MTLHEFYITKPNGERAYFNDIKKANEFAQKQANETKRTVVRYDIHGGQSWFYYAGVVDGYKVYGGNY